MCAQCVAQATPMVGAGLVMLRRRSLMSWARLTFGASRNRVAAGPSDAAGRGDRAVQPAKPETSSVS